jgi:hypothetical protein
MIEEANIAESGLCQGLDNIETKFQLASADRGMLVNDGHSVSCFLNEKDELCVTKKS